MKIGVIGLGHIGGRIAKRLLSKGHTLSVYDVNSIAIKQLEELGAEGFSSLHDLANQNEIIITILPNASIVKQVVLGENGLRTGFHPKSLLIDMTSSDPEITKEIGRSLKEVHVDMLDAPVSGGVQKAETGELTIMVGGDSAILDRVMPILQGIGNVVTHVGELGAGHTLKALNNLLFATTFGATAEVIATGVKMGLDPEKMIHVLNCSSGRSYASETIFPNVTRDFQVNAMLEIVLKDVGIALELTQRGNLSGTISNAVHELWQDAFSQLGGKVDYTELAKYIEQIADVEIIRSKS
jgi:3-hydroxyisobutyrate dehydrogenase-like beta-hydroxyacid dehydrogenase